MTNATKPAVPPFDATSVEIPDDEPRQIVCTGEDGSGVWQPGFGTWEHDDFGIDCDEPAGEGERLFVNRRIYDALLRELTVTLACNRGLVRLNEATQFRAEAAEAEVKRLTRDLCSDRLLVIAQGKHVAELEADLVAFEDVMTKSDWASSAARLLRRSILRALTAEADADKARRFRDIARDEVKEWHEVAVSHAARVAELEAALPRAWEAGRDAAATAADYAGAIQDQRDGSYAGSVAVMGRDVGDIIRALTPPADLAKGGEE